ncbi:MAG: Stp1/IreP family PP2C-type Ser/Thr phosphatase [Candidatus Latescibacteria bacterium]|nr:Stp1/IreP family PP2C-type Ser/Thr phosphatase [Candidatus Latescibacterota bacterium]NIO78663.1 Stp1/IreP family PP2C-type Ser/Thr phosphatase [Candidatus Latescibacterota bacterium]
MTTVIELEAAAMSNTGQVRKSNEDSFGTFEPEEPSELAEKGALYIVADGMGGHRGGEVASNLAVETIRAHYYSSTDQDPSTALVDAFNAANRAIHEKAVSDNTLFGMGTTCTAMVVRGEKAYFAHVGDSRAYLFRKGKLQQVTEDHSLVGEMLRSGMISREDARVHPQRNVITRSLGVQQAIQPYIPPVPYDIEDGDVFLLCSDGLTALVIEDDIVSALELYNSHEACRRLIDLANQRGGIDNITVQIIEVRKR